MGIASWLCLNQHITDKSIECRVSEWTRYPCSALSVVGSYASNAETAIVSIEYLYRQRLLRIEDLTVIDTRVLELCYRTQGVAGLTSLTSYQ